MRRFSVYLNPVRESATVAFDSEGGHVQVLLFDTMGREALRLLDRELPRRPQQLRLSASGRAAGSHYCHVREGSSSSGGLLVMERQARHRSVSSNQSFAKSTPFIAAEPSDDDC